MRDELKELWRFRELLVTMIEREMRIRYKNSVLGFFWSLLNPLFTVLVMTVVFKYLLGNPMESFSAYILAAYLPYLFFNLALMDAAQSVLVALPVVKKVYFPREILPLAHIGSNIIHFILALGVYFIFMLAVWILNPGVFPFTQRLLFLPVLLILQFSLTTGLSLIIAALNTFYEDVKYITGFALQLLFFVSPIMYFSENVFYAVAKRGPGSEWIYTLYHLNPIAMLCTAYRKVLVQPRQIYVDGKLVDAIPLNWQLFGVTAVVCLATLVFGYHVFNKAKWRFVERP